MSPNKDIIVQPFEIRVDGYPETATYYAATSSKARYVVYDNYFADNCSFKEFLGRVHVRKGVGAEGFGEEILVSGELAYRVPDTPHLEKYQVRFVHPGSDVLRYSHPNDVTPVGQKKQQLKNEDRTALHR